MSEVLKLPRWVILWLIISTVIVLWDAAFVLCRPASFPGGDLGFLWSFAYETYLAVDRSYADVANHTIAAFAVMSILEACVVCVAVIADRKGRGYLAHLLVMLVTSLTGAKTMLFFLVDGMHGWPAVGHNELLPLLAFWVIPNGIWIVVPLTIATLTGRKLLRCEAAQV